MDEKPPPQEDSGPIVNGAPSAASQVGSSLPPNNPLGIAGPGVIIDLADSSMAEVRATQRRGKDGRRLMATRDTPRANRPDQRTNGILRVGYTHDALIDAILAHPERNMDEFAEIFGYRSGGQWIGKVINSDAFQERLAERRKEIIDPALLATIETRFKVMVDRSLEILLDKLDPAHNPTADLALATLNTASRALGYGAKTTAVQVNNKIEIVHKVS